MAKRIVWTAALVASLLSTAAVAESGLSDSAASAARTLKEMGFNPKTEKTDAGSPFLTFDVGDTPTNMFFNGCDKNEAACSNFSLTSSFTDVVNPPADWVEKANADFSLIKIYVRSDDKVLGFSMGVVSTGLTRAGLKANLDLWAGSANTLAQDVTTAGLLKK